MENHGIGIMLILIKELFRRIGRVVRLQLKFDRAGRSEGIAFVTYEHKDDADEAVKQFDGANANGMMRRPRARSNMANIQQANLSA